ncbi:WD repeat-containing protein 63-like [Apis dorsata]|uniref:WD repeat-containing protein 63-like n=1 Tax=Apis dorsata TaxID=7462 RepID=UPI0003DF7F08|nr:WD repeat-containing protein 63-like [Apis dorsata]
MSKKRVKYKHGWTLIDENIENVERVKLNPEMQRELGCLVGEHVFLEYPWAYVDRNVIAKYAKLSDSSLAPFREIIDIYEADTFLVGYSSIQLNSDDFVICLTEKAKRLIRQRNKTITGIISRKVIDRVIKTARPWNSLGSDTEVDENFVRNRREFFEIEILLPGRMLNSSRTLSDRGASDSRDSYIQLVNEDEKFENIERKCISKAIQTCLQPRETFVQTCPIFPKNAWTQYDHEDILKETPVVEEKKQVNEESERNNDNRSQVKNIDQSNEDLEDEKPKEKTPLELFLETRSQEMIDVIKYNAAVNLYVDDIESLSKQENKISTIEVATLSEQVSFIDLSFTGNKAISDISLHSKFKEHVAISYITISNRTLKTECLSEGEFQTRVLVWKLNDPLRPHLVLQDHREIYSVSFCPYNDDYVIGGCSTGQVIIWNINHYLNNISDNKTVKFRTAQNNLPILRPTVVSHKHHSHRLPIRKIRWIPAKYRIEPNGNLTRSSITFNIVFLTVSEDGIVIVWNVCFRSRRTVNHDSEDFDELLHPIFRLKIPTFSENSQSFTPLCFCLDEQNENSPDTNDSKNKDFRKYLWLGCAEGLLKCKWGEHAYEGNLTDTVECNILNCSYVHNGPVIEIVRSSHVRDVLLSIGGQVFAIWNDDHMDSPLFWRRNSARYTSCCWANEPGVFFLGSEDGNLEVWNINSDSNQPIFTQVVSSRSITCLILLPLFRGEDVKMIGVGDHGGLFRAFKEPEICRGSVTTERMDWFEEYAWRETRRKKLFASWQNDFLANDPVVIAKRSARRDEEREKKAKEAREKLRREQQTRLRLEAEKRARSAPVPKDVAWKSREFDRMKQVLLNKKRIVPTELEAKRAVFVAMKAERDAKLEKVRNRIAHRDEQFLNTISVEFPILSESKIESSEFEKFTPIELGKSIDDYVEKFNEIRRKAKEMLTNNFAS